MGQIASEALAVGLRERAPEETQAWSWPSKQMGRPRIDLDDREALGRLLDEEYLRRLERQ